MRNLRYATFGVALALGAAQAHAQIVSRQITNEPVETTVIEGPVGTVITRRPVTAPVAPLPAPVAVAPVASDTVRVGTAAYMDETVGVAPAATRSVTRSVTRRAVHETVGHAPVAPRRVVSTRTVARTVHHVGVAPRLVLAPPQRRIVYRTIVQRQVIAPAVPAVVPAPPPGYPPYPTPAYATTTVVAPAETTGYAVRTPAADYDYDDVYTEAVPPATVPLRYTVGARLPGDVVLTRLPAAAAVAVPAVRPYSYAAIDGRVLLVDPVTHMVVADITP